MTASIPKYNTHPNSTLSLKKMRNILLLFSLTVLLYSCKDKEDPAPDLTFKNRMKDFVIDISHYAKGLDSNFIIIPQNGIELATKDGDDHGEPDLNYLNAIDGNGQEDLFYGYDLDDVATPSEDNAYLRRLLDISKNSGNTILVTDYVSTPGKMDASYQKNADAGYVSFAADHRDLDHIPSYPTPIHNENSETITHLAQAKNFLYLINPEPFSSKADFINAVTATNYDALIMDLFFKDGTTFSAGEINQLKNKANGGKRLVFSYMSIGEAEDYRYYWQSDWATNPPSWLKSVNPDWPGNFKVEYWNPDWQQIIFGNDDSYLKMILEAGFDGVYLDIIDGFEYFE